MTLLLRGFCVFCTFEKQKELRLGVRRLMRMLLWSIRGCRLTWIDASRLVLVLDGAALHSGMVHSLKRHFDV